MLQNTIERITLHIGAHRTGTTQLQQLLDRNSSVLRQAGICALTPPYPGKRNLPTIRNILRAHYYQFRFFSSLPLVRNKFLTRLRRKTFQQLVSLLSDNVSHLIISDEQISGPIFDAKTGACIYPHSDMRFDAISHLLGDKVDRVFLGIKPYDKFLASSYAMTAIWGRKPRDFDKYRDRLIKLERSWIAYVSSVQQFFKNAEILVWTHDRIGDQSRFLEITQVGRGEEINWLKNVPVNMAPTPKAIAAYQKASNRKYLTPHERDLIVEKYPACKENGVFDPFSENEKNSLLNKYDADLEALKKMNHLTILSNQA